ncbi:MAG: sulfatase-like hydrolase/transferase, partial [Planctomycetia bacterium]
MNPIIRTTLALVIACLAAAPAAAAPPTPRPNIVLIMADDFGYECVAANGGESYATPHLDRLAATGLRFTHCFVQPLCTPTRVELMTGKSNVRNYVRFGLLPRGERTFANLLHEAGYATAVCGKWQLGREPDLPRHFGFDESFLWQHTRRPPRYANPGLEVNGVEKDFRDGEYGPTLVNDFALDFLARHAAAARRGEKPFFLYYPMMLTHGPFQPTPDSADWDPRAVGEKVNDKPRHFADMVAFMDTLVGRLVDRLDELGLRENTLLLFLGDNGTASGLVSRFEGRDFKGGKGLSTHRGMHVPGIANWPGRVPAGRVCDDLVTAVDFLPTICEATGTPLPPGIDGHSFAPQLRGERGTPRDFIYSWYSPRNGGSPKVREAAFDRHFKLDADGDLYDLSADPDEKRPIPLSEATGAAAAAARKLRGVLDQFAGARPAELDAAAVDAPDEEARTAEREPNQKPSDRERRPKKKPRRRGGAAVGRPNILWLVAEDTSAGSLSCYGGTLARTPTLDTLASRSVVFDRCFTIPVCAPSRFMLITGLYPASCGPAQHMRAQGRIGPEIVGFPTLLRQAGYYTTNNAKTDYNAPIDVKACWNASGKDAHYRHRPDPAQPFFAVFNHEVTHESCLFPEREVDLPFPAIAPESVRVPPYQPDTPEIRADWARHANHLGLLDIQIRKHLDELEAAGLADDTIVFFYGDNGGVTPRSKRCLQATGTHVPLLLHVPKKWRHLAPAEPGSRVADPVGFVDFAATVLAMAGVAHPDHMQGESFAGPDRRPHDHVFCSRDRMDERYDMSRSVMSRRWLYIRHFRPDIPAVQPLAYQFRGRGYQSWAAEAAAGRLTPDSARFWGPKPPEELYDLESDPDNVRNLAADPAHADTIASLRLALERHMIATVDNGLVPEGSPLEGYEASRAGGFPVKRAFDLAILASTAEPHGLGELVRAVDDPSEPIRWGGAQGIARLGVRQGPRAVAGGGPRTTPPACGRGGRR